MSTAENWPVAERKEAMTIALDFDDTLTADPQMWGAFIGSARDLGHLVYIVTARRGTEDNSRLIDGYLSEHNIEVDDVHFTDLASKLWHMGGKLGIHVDIWIDDHPESLVNGR